MRKKNPALPEVILDYIDSYQRTHTDGPTFAEIAEGTKIPKTTAFRYVKGLVGEKKLARVGETYRTEKSERYQTEFVSAPLVGSIRCGDPENEEEQIEEYVALPTSLFGKGEFYLLRAEGDSMEDAGIHSGDLVVILRTTEAKEGDIVVALDENNENTLKTYAGNDPNSGCAILAYENRAVYGEKKILVKQLTVTGVATHVIRSLVK